MPCSSQLQHVRQLRECCTKQTSIGEDLKLDLTWGWGQHVLRGSDITLVHTQETPYWTSSLQAYQVKSRYSSAQCCEFVFTWKVHRTMLPVVTVQAFTNHQTLKTTCEVLMTCSIGFRSMYRWGLHAWVWHSGMLNLFNRMKQNVLQCFLKHDERGLVTSWSMLGRMGSWGVSWRCISWIPCFRSPWRTHPLSSPCLIEGPSWWPSSAW